MQLNRQTDYALRALLFLGMQKELSTIDAVAQKFFIAREHLTKIISRLAKLNLVIATRGKGGGLKLNPEALTISLAEIVEQFEPTLQVIDCEKPICPLVGVCHLQRILNEASNAFLTVLSKYTLGNILPQTKAEKIIFADKLQVSLQEMVNG